MKERRQFVLWKIPGKKEKQPAGVNKRGRLVFGEWQNPENWLTFDEAMELVKQGKAGGIGFAFNGNGIYGLDGDNVYMDGELIPEMQYIVDTLGCYTARSSSGEGLHVFVYASSVDLLTGLDQGKLTYVFPGYEPITYIDENGKEKKKYRQVEYYQSSGYFALTGIAIDNVMTIEGKESELQAVFARYGKPSDSVELPDDEISVSDYEADKRYLDTGLLNDSELISRWKGERPTGNESQDDLGLMNKLAHWCNHNPELMKEAFASSPYFDQKDPVHKKKGRRKDYLARTIKKAIAGTPTTARDKDAAYRANSDKASITEKGKHHNKPNLTGLCAANVIIKPVTWLWKDIFVQAALNSIQGIAGIGKTFLLCAISAAVSSGGNVQSVNGNLEKLVQGNVLYLTGDDDISTTLVPRMNYFTADLNKIYFAPDNVLPCIGSPQLEFLFDMHKPSLAIIDTLQHFIPERTELNSANSTTVALQPLKILAEKYNCSVVVIQHINKISASGNGGFSVNFGIGSSAVNALFRSVWTLGRVKGEDGKPTGVRALAPSKANLVAGDPPSVLFELTAASNFQWAGIDSSITAEQLYDTQRKRASGGESALDEAKEFLLDVLKDGKQPSKEIISMSKQYGISEMTLKRAREELQVDCKERQGFGRNTVVYWKMPDSTGLEQSTESIREGINKALKNNPAQL